MRYRKKSIRKPQNKPKRESIQNCGGAKVQGRLKILSGKVKVHLDKKSNRVKHIYRKGSNVPLRPKSSYLYKKKGVILTKPTKLAGKKRIFYDVKVN